MLVSSIINHLVSGETSNLAIKDVGDVTSTDTPTAVQAANRLKYISYINLANTALHTRFQLVTKTYEIDDPTDGEEYKLPSDFLAPKQAYYAADYEVVPIREYTKYMLEEQSNDINSMSLLLPSPLKALIKGVDPLERDLILFDYVASPKEVTAVTDDIEISAAYLEALINYAAYKAHNPLDGSVDKQTNSYYQRYENSCKQIVNAGMWTNEEVDNSFRLDTKGFV